MFFDGQTVSYVGEPYGDTPTIGDIGIVVSAGHTASHVKWTTGPRKDTFTEMPHHEIVAATNLDPLHANTLVTFAVTEVHETRGILGIIASLSEEGHLGGFDQIAEDALAFVASRVRSDPSIQEVLASLPLEDGDDLVSVASVTLLADAFGRG